MNNIVKKGEHWYIRIMIRGRDVWKATGTTNKKEAEMMARKFKLAIRQPWFARMEEENTRVKMPTIEEVIASYSEKCQFSVTNKTLKGNISSLKRIAAAVGATKPSQLNDVQAWAYNRLVDVTDQARQASIVRSILSDIRQAKSVFSEKALAAMEYPALDAPKFRVQLPKMQNVGLGFRPFDPEAIEAFESEMQSIKEEEPNIYALYLLMGKCGFRNSEAKASRGLWIGKRTIRIRREPDYTPKTENSLREIPIGDLAWDYLGCKAGLVDRLVKNFERTEAELNQIMRKHFPGRQKGCYELRKWAGSQVATRDGILAAARFLGDSTATAEKYYCALLKPLVAI